MKRIKFIRFFLLGLFFSFMCADVVWAEVHIADDTTGGDCISIGTWDENSKTCLLTTDINETIWIDDDYITLDGGGYNIIGDGSGYGIILENRTGVTIKNVEVKSFNAGIYLLWSNNNTLSKITAEWNSSGIEVYDSDYNSIDDNVTNNNSGRGILISHLSTNNTITKNSALSNSSGGIQVNYSSDNIIRGNLVQYSQSSGIALTGESYDNEVIYNEIDRNRFGITLQSSSHHNSISDNNITENGLDHVAGGAGIYISYNSDYNKIFKNEITQNFIGVRISDPDTIVSGSDYNQIYNNNFIDNPEHALVSGKGIHNQFNLAEPTGGNYWNNWFSPDIDGNGFVDVAFVFSGGIDNLPWTVPDGWLDIDTTPPIIIIDSPGPLEYLHSHILEIAFSATDDSGLAESPIAALDDLEIPNGFSINLLTLQLGTHNLIVTACDTKNNCGDASVSFNIIANLGSLVDAVKYFTEQGMISGNVSKNLLTKLSEAEKGIENGATIVAVNKLRDFIKQVNVKKEKHLTKEAAFLLVTDAEYVLERL